jgi:Tol biopolymer transport system component
MLGVIRRGLVLVVAVLAVAGIVPPTFADVPTGPRLVFLQFGYRPDALTIGTSDAALGKPATVAGGVVRVRPLPYPFSGPAWSPDGSLIAFSGMTGPLPELLEARNRRIYLVEASGAAIRAIPGTKGGFGPVFSPDGQSIAFAKTIRRHLEPHGWFSGKPWKSTTVWSVGIDGSGLRQLTEWANGVEDLPSSFSPAGSVLGLTHRDVFRDRADAMALRLDGGGSYVLSEDASWPRYSPDGSRIAFLGIRRVGDTSCCEHGDGFSVDLYAMNADGSSRLRLTDTPAKAERPASWDPSGEHLAYTTKSAPTGRTSGDLEAAVMQINADESCPSRLSVPAPRYLGPHTSFHYPAWQPGPGRDAGRIAC